MSIKNTPSTWKSYVFKKTSLYDTNFYNEVAEYLNSNFKNLHPVLIKMDFQVYFHQPSGKNYYDTIFQANILYNKNGMNAKGFLKDEYVKCPAKSAQSVVVKEYAEANAIMCQDVSQYLPVENQICSPLVSSITNDGEHEYSYMFEVENAIGVAPANKSDAHPKWEHISEIFLTEEYMKNKWESMGEEVSPFCTKASLCRFDDAKGMLDIFYTKSVPNASVKSGMNPSEAAVPFDNYKGEWVWQWQNGDSNAILDYLNHTGVHPGIYVSDDIGFLSKICASAWGEGGKQYCLMIPAPGLYGYVGSYLALNVEGIVYPNRLHIIASDDPATDSALTISKLTKEVEKAHAVWRLVRLSGESGSKFCIRLCNDSDYALTGPTSSISTPHLAKVGSTPDENQIWETIAYGKNLNLIFKLKNGNYLSYDSNEKTLSVTKEKAKAVQISSHSLQ